MTLITPASSLTSDTPDIPAQHQTLAWIAPTIVFGFLLLVLVAIIVYFGGKKLWNFYLDRKYPIRKIDLKIKEIEAMCQPGWQEKQSWCSRVTNTFAGSCKATIQPNDIESQLITLSCEASPTPSVLPDPTDSKLPQIIISDEGDGKYNAINPSLPTEVLEAARVQLHTITCRHLVFPVIYGRPYLQTSSSPALLKGHYTREIADKIDHIYFEEFGNSPQAVYAKKDLRRFALLNLASDTGDMRKEWFFSPTVPQHNA
ncbi:hypothetical protein C8Q75DRAFT_732066 [Abortiporus biennis]|nr:hypothetical protein C8Q75DRAFT_732066 [Abortiporus biennis]